MEQSKSSEDLEFQKLEREMKQEEKESESQELLREIAECQRLSVTRKVQSLSDRVFLIFFFYFACCACKKKTVLLPLHVSLYPKKVSKMLFCSQNTEAPETLFIGFIRNLM